jgi:hypothetical protein
MRPRASIFGVLVVLLALPHGAATARRDWQTGTWTKVDVSRQVVDFGPGSSSFGGPPSQTPAMRAMADVRIYVIETSDLRLEIKDVVPIGRRAVDAEVGQPVTFALDKNTVYIRDPDGTEHKLRVTKKTPK